MRCVRRALVVVLAGLIGCGSSQDVVNGGSANPVDKGNDDDEKDGGSKKDSSSGNKDDEDDEDDEDEPEDDDRAPAVRDSGTASNPDASKEPENCGMSSVKTGSTIPDMMIVLDRSASMRPGMIRADLRCDNIDPLDFLTPFECLGVGIDCTRADQADLVYCGGTQTIDVIDRWAPSVAALRSLTSTYDQDVAFGLITFPDGNETCAAGRVQVPLDLGVADDIAQVLQSTEPAGGTPTGESLQAALTEFRAVSSEGDGRAAPAQYVLLVTDGQPTCPNGRAITTDPALLEADKQLTLDAIDALAAEGIKTFVVGYDAELDPQFAQALTEFAEHGGTERYYPVIDEASLVTAFRDITTTVITCDFEFGAPVHDPSYLLVKLDDTPLRPNDPNGWSFSNNVITVQGEACATLQEGQGHKVEITLECKPQMIM